MSDDPTPRQVLYALVGGGFLSIVGLLTVGGAVARFVPIWWTAIMTLLVLGAGVWTVVRWRDTSRVLMISIGLLVLWMVGTLLLA